MLVILSGVSGTGKNTIINHLLLDAENRFLIKSATTRAPRGECMDNNYEFVTDEEFDRREKNGEFFETINIHTHRSATQFKELQKIVDNPQNIYFKDLDVIGTQKITDYLKDKAKVLTIFVDVPNDILYQRLIARGETDEKAKLRLSRGTLEREYKKYYDLVIDNIDLDETLNTIRDRLKKEGY